MDPAVLSTTSRSCVEYFHISCRITFLLRAGKQTVSRINAFYSRGCETFLANERSSSDIFSFAPLLILVFRMQSNIDSILQMREFARNYGAFHLNYWIVRDRTSAHPKRRIKISGRKRAARAEMKKKKGRKEKKEERGNRRASSVDEWRKKGRLAKETCLLSFSFGDFVQRLRKARRELRLGLSLIAFRVAETAIFPHGFINESLKLACHYVPVAYLYVSGYLTTSNLNNITPVRQR